MGPELVCLALTVFFESRSEPVAGQVAVAQVVMNRVEDPLFPDTVCEVVYQGGEELNRCHFSFYCDGQSDRPESRKSELRWEQAWDRAVIVASAVMAGSGHADFRGITQYHASYVQPWWAEYYEWVATIGRHEFYRRF